MEASDKLDKKDSLGKENKVENTDEEIYLDREFDQIQEGKACGDE